MDLVDLGVLAAAEPASALHQIVRFGLYPRPEAVAVKWLLRPDMVVDEIAPGAASVSVTGEQSAPLTFH